MTFVRQRRIGSVWHRVERVTSTTVVTACGGELVIGLCTIVDEAPLECRACGVER